MKYLTDCTDEELQEEVKRRDEIKYFIFCANRECTFKVDKRRDEPFCKTCEALYDIISNYNKDK